MGQKHPGFTPKRFFETYTHDKTIVDNVYGELFSFINKKTKNLVIVQVIDVDVQKFVPMIK